MTEIQRERQLLQDAGLEIVYREEWGAVEDYTSDRALNEVADMFFLHIALVNDPSDLQGDEFQVARNVERIGQQRFGSGMSYNALAFNTGLLVEGQPLTRRGAHTVNTYERDYCLTHGGSMVGPRTSTGYNLNVNARALCLPQMVDDPVTPEQIDSAARWAAAQIISGLAKKSAKWHGHRCVTAKGCPGDIAFKLIGKLQELTDYYVKNGLGMNEQDKKDIAKLVVEELLEHRIEVKRGGEGKLVKIKIGQIIRELFQRS